MGKSEGNFLKRKGERVKVRDSEARKKNGHGSRTESKNESRGGSNAGGARGFGGAADLLVSITFFIFGCNAFATRCWRATLALIS